MRALQGDLRAEPQRGGGAQPLIMHHGAKAPKADSFFVFFECKADENLPI